MCFIRVRTAGGTCGEQHARVFDWNHQVDKISKKIGWRSIECWDQVGSYFLRQNIRIVEHDTGIPRYHAGVFTRDLPLYYFVSESLPGPIIRNKFHFPGKTSETYKQKSCPSRPNVVNVWCQDPMKTPRIQPVKLPHSPTRPSRTWKKGKSITLR